VRVRTAIGLLLLAAATFVGSVADAGEPDRAKTLFKEGIDEMQAGNYASACPKIEEAYQLTQGTGALFTLAECYAQWGRPATALGHYRAYLTLYARLPADVRGKQEERAKLATTQVAALGALVPTLRIVLTGDDRRGATVTVDGQTVPNEALDGPLELEAGTHRAVVTAADGRTVEQSFDLAEGVQRRWEAKLQSPTTAPAPKQKTSPTGGRGTPAKTAGFVIGGIGVAAIAVGAVTGGLALGKRSTVDEHCAALICDQQGLDAAGSGRTLGDVSTATLVIGSAALVTGVVLLIVGYQGSKTEAMSLTPHGVGWRF